MASKWSPGRWLYGTQRTWASLTKSGVWIAAVIGGFLLPPPVGAGQFGEANWTRLAQFVIVVVVGLILVFTSKYQSRKHAAGWALVAAGSIVIAVASLFAYLNFAEMWTTNYYGERLVVGTELTELGKDYETANKGVSTETRVEDFAGRVDTIWTRESIQSRRLTLGLAYLGTLPFFTLAILSVVQALNCAKKRK
jgi:predicted membrane channel-forming protein YqfA (hemolysin III family)